MPESTAESESFFEALNRFSTNSIALRPLCISRNKRNEYTLGAFVDGCFKLFSKHKLSVEIHAVAEDAQEVWQQTDVNSASVKVEQLQFIRNQVGCHFIFAG